MAGTGIHGYTGYTSNGQYIQNGIIQSQPSANDYVNAVKTAATNTASTVNSNVNTILNNTNANQLASQFAGIAGMDTSDYADYLRRALDISANNTALSQQLAREQMQYQTQSDATAMAWSASEAEKNRQWQERLSNTAHYREVQDLIAAGLNPILAANNGAFTGSGATGQGFSSSGAMGQVDTSAAGIVGQLASAYINTASQAAVAGMYTDAQRYQADMQYAQAKLNVDANLLMNDKNITSNEKMNKLNSDTALQNANTAASANLGAASMTSGATIQASLNNMTAAILGHELSNEASHYKTDIDAAVALKGQTNQWNIEKMKDDTNKYGTVLNNASKLYSDPFASAKGTANKATGNQDLFSLLDDAVREYNARNTRRF